MVLISVLFLLLQFAVSSQLLHCLCLWGFLCCQVLHCLCLYWVKLYQFLAFEKPVELLTMLMALIFLHWAPQILAQCGSARVEHEHKSLQKTLVLLLGLLVPLGMISDL